MIYTIESFRQVTEYSIYAWESYRCEVFTLVLMKIPVFWDMILSACK